jgi:arylsulfatase A-like enzyme
VGAVVSLFKGYEAGYRGLIPPYVVLTEPQGRFSEAGFLGTKYKPFATGGDPAATKFVVEGVVAQGISEERQRNRREFLHNLNTLEHAMNGDPRIAALAQCEKEAYDLILGDAGKVFDLSTEKTELRDRYGRNTFGQSCLMARRLVERGVPYVTINYKGWDTHKQNFETMRRKLPELDKGMGTLIQDLAGLGLLDSTIVWWGGEFGRTPRVQWESPWNGGRGHHGKVFSAVVAGGGFKGGHVVGASDRTGEEVKERPVYPCDLIGSIYELLGIPSEAKLPHPQGLLTKATPSAPDGVKTGGRLTEIM